MSKAIGIDLGTSNSAAAVMEAVRSSYHLPKVQELPQVKHFRHLWHSLKTDNV